MGGFNHIVNKLESVREMIEEEGWADVGGKADWRGREKDNRRVTRMLRRGKQG